ncbi:MAG TPA: acyl-CoA synthetase [Acidimicrobiales bacterium]|nr:acyl-CoA synthetase [Acidimicrobiales bacterium]
MPGWNIAEIWEAVAEAQPEAPAQVQGDRRLTWAEFDRRADGVAKALLDLGVERQDKVAQYLHNCPEYLESLFGAWKAGLVPVNTNYRYTESELTYLWDNADAVAVVFHGAFTETIERILADVPRVRLWLWVDDGSGPCPDWATPYEDAADSATGRTVPEWGRAGDDLYMLYTGGTTGMPKGVMWRQDDLFHLLNSSSPSAYDADGTIDDVKAKRQSEGPGFGAIPACPLMHGTGALISFAILTGGGTIVLLPSRSFDAEELFDVLEKEQANAAVIVGDAFAKPMVRALDAEPDRWNISSLLMMYSSGVMWSESTKQGLLKHNPGMMLIDALGSSEAIGMGTNLSAGEDAAKTAKFSLGENAVVITDDGRLVEPGSGEIGRVGIKGRVPVGYYKDPEKSAATFPEIDGVRYSIPGDYATVESDGSVTLLGRGSVCINTGGEKVFPEEVEEALKTYPGVRDAVAVGVPDDKFGEAVTAVVELDPGAEVDEGDVIKHVKGSLAAFKAPKHVIVVETIGRAPNAKVDYKRLKQLAAERIAVRS